MNLRSPTLLGEKTAKCLLVLLVTRGRGCFAKVDDQSIVDTDAGQEVVSDFVLV